MSRGAFAAAIRMAETGTFDGNYQKVQGLVRNGRKVGAYGFASDEWRELAASAGVDGARWADPKAQDRVARHYFDDLHRKYGDWRLVAAAWHAGEDVADKLAADPSLFDHPNLVGLKAYVESVMSHANDAATLHPGEGTVEAVAPFPVSTGDLNPTGDSAGMPQAQSNGEAYMRRVLVAMRNAQRRNGQQVAVDDEPAIDERSSEDVPRETEPAEGMA